MRRVTYRFSYAMSHNNARRWAVIAKDILIMREVIEFQSSLIAIYYKIHFCVLLQPMCAGEVPDVIVIVRFLAPTEIQW